MKNICKKITSLFLCLILLISIAPTVNATEVSNDWRISEDGISLIKKFEGFSKYPYWDYGHYTVGYGTTCPEADYERYVTDGISEEEATKLFKSALRYFEKKVNNFANNNNLTLTQNQFDALVSFSYNCGCSWMSSENGTFTNAVLDGRTGNDFIFAIAQWCVAGNSILEGLVNRRLVEANIYLNKVYSATPPQNYKYVLFNHNIAVDGTGTTKIRIQAYDASVPADIVSVGYKEGYRFLGWYDEEIIGQSITKLDDTLEKGQTLYARWQKDEGNVISNNIILGTEANYVRSTIRDTKIYSNPSVLSASVDILHAGRQVKIVADYVNQSGVKWGRLSYGGWINLADTESTIAAYGSDIITEAKVVEESANQDILSKNIQNNTSSNKIVGKIISADINIYEIVNLNQQLWGKTDLGWLCLNYLDILTF